MILNINAIIDIGITIINNLIDIIIDIIIYIMISIILLLFIIIYIIIIIFLKGESLTLIGAAGTIGYIRLRDERIIMAQGRMIGRGLLVTCGLLLSSAARWSD